MNLSTLNGSNGFKLSGVAAIDVSGISVSAAGDVNGDGFDDVVIGAKYGTNSAGIRAGTSYVVFGKANGFAANVNLSSLNGSNGFRLGGVAQGDYAGFAVSAAGDVNGDGWSDLVIGAFGADPAGSGSGASYVVFGKSSGFASDVDLSTLNGGNGFVINGAAFGDNSGRSVSGAGDFNGDGFDDVIIGARAADPHGDLSGASYLIFGKASGFAASLSLSALNGSNGFVIEGVTTFDNAGQPVSAAGDVNGDGFDDLLIGAYPAGPNGAGSGASYVIFGSSLGPFPSIAVSDATVVEPATGSALATFTLTLSSASGSAVTVQYATSSGTATAPDDFTAVSLATVTFAPGETSKTVSVSVQANGPSEVNETFFVNLTNPTNATISDGQGIGTIVDKGLLPLSSLNGSNGFKINGQITGDRAGGAVSDAGDVNGDGFGDLIIGAPMADPRGANSGASYVVFGKAGGFATNLNLSTLNGSNGFKLSGTLAGNATGVSVSRAGDVNGDGFGDLIVGASEADTANESEGVSYVIFGKATGFVANFDLATLNGTNGFKLSGEARNDFSGISVSAAGDLNRDGFGDLIVGASGASPIGPSSGVSYVIFGKANGFAANLNLSSLNGTNGFKLIGEMGGDLSGRSVSGAGDVNGDGFADVLVGAFSAVSSAGESGVTYVVFGKASGFTASVNLASLNGSTGFKVSGARNGDFVGYSVSDAGDLNGDGLGDILIGAPRSSPNGTYSGSSYVVFGKAGGFAAEFNLSTVNGTNGFRMTGAAAGDETGWSVSGAGDFNGDGFDDLIVGAHGAPNSAHVGASYLVFGKAGGFAADLNLAMLNGANGIKLTGVAANDYTGVSVSGAGDLNGDGFDELVIGAADFRATRAGTSYVVFGHGVAFSVSDAEVAEGNAGSTALQFTVSLSEPGDVPVSVKVATASGSALSGSDFTAVGLTTVTFAPGETSKTVTVEVAADALFENDETFSLTLSAAVGGLIRDGTGVGTIRNDDAAPVLSIADATFLEGDSGTGTATFTVSLSAPSGLPASGQFASANGTALAGSDYTALTPGTLTFAPGETSKTITVNVLGDTSIEDPETFTVSLSSASGATIGIGAATGTILNDDTALRLSGTGSLLEGDSGTGALQFTVSLEKASALPVTVDYAATDGTATLGSDYALIPGTLTFAPGETSKTITVSVLGDTSIEDHESFSVALTNAARASIVSGTAAGTILNDDTTLRLDDARSFLEGDAGSGAFSFSVQLEKASALPVTVSFATADGTASAGSDYAPASGSLTFAPGETNQTIVVGVLGDVSIEDHETFSLALSGAVNSAIAHASTTGTILNDDTALRVTESVGVVEGNSGTSGLVLTVSLEKASALPVTVSYATADGTAVAGSDYAPASGSLTFNPGETSLTIPIAVMGDLSIEDHESFSFLLTNALNATVLTGTATGTILNDDTALHLTGISAREGNSGSTPFALEITLEKPSALPVTVSYATADGTANAGADYVAILPTQITFAPGETAKTVTIAVAGDTEVEAHESFSVVLSSAMGAVLADSTATGTILNDETLVRITDASVLEGHTGTRTLLFTVSLTAATTLPVRVNFTSEAGTATAGADYLALAAGGLDFSPGETTKTLSITVNGDTLAEASETLSILLPDATNAVIDDGLGLGTILNDDVTITSRRQAIFTDVDGDLVTIRVDRGTLKVEDFTLFPSGAGSQLALVDFHEEAEFSGASLTLTAKIPRGSALGDGLVNVGYIDATGIDLGKITLSGNLGRIDAGDALATKAGLRALSAWSLGDFGLGTQLPGGSGQSHIAGDLGTLALRDGLQGAALLVSGNIGSLGIRGDVRDSVIRSDGKITSIKIGGDLAGGEEDAIISSRGLLQPRSKAQALAIGRLTVGGEVDHAQILAGYDLSGAGSNGQVRIGAVVVAGDWSASSLAAGVRAGSDQKFGTQDDAAIFADTSSIVASIASITIRGAARGNSTAGEHFGFVAAELGQLSVAGEKIALLRGAGNDLAGQPVGASGNLRAREAVS